MLAYCGAASAAVPINFDPDGAPGGQPVVSVVTFDWQPSNFVIVGGVPAAGLQVNDTVIALAQARLAVLTNSGGEIIALPAGTEFTYIASIPLRVTATVLGGSIVTFEFSGDVSDNANYFEMWTGAPDSNDLVGAGFNNGKRILYGKITALNESFIKESPIVLLDQFNGDDWNGQRTYSLTGSYKIDVSVIVPDANYFPNFTPDKIDTLISRFNSSSINPYEQADPSRAFVAGFSGFDGSAPQNPSVFPNLGPINGESQPNQTLDLLAQADPNQSFEFSAKPPLGCRVTYGGNDQNGNIDPKKFGEACGRDNSVNGNRENCYTFGGQAGAPSGTGAKGGPFGEHTHHQKSGPAGDFVFRAGTSSAPKNTRIDAIVCKDEGACRQAAANGNFKQIDFEGTGSFRVLDPTARQYLSTRAGFEVLPDNASDRKYYFRVDMDDLGEPGNQWASGKKSVVNELIASCKAFFNADPNEPLATADPIFTSFFGPGVTERQACSSCPDVYQIRIYSGETRDAPGNLIYEARGFLTGGNIQIHRLIR